MDLIGIISYRKFAERLRIKLLPYYEVLIFSPENIEEIVKYSKSSDHFILLVELPELIHCNYLLARDLHKQNIAFSPLGFKNSPFLDIVKKRFNCPFGVTEETDFQDLIAELENFFEGKIDGTEARVDVDDMNIGDAELNPTEYEILYWICKDLSTKEIAQLVHRSPRTVENVRSRLMSRIEVNGVAGLVKWAYDHGVVYPILGKKFYRKFLK